MLDNKSKIKVFGNNDEYSKPVEKKVEKKTMKCKFHKVHDRHCVDCAKV